MTKAENIALLSAVFQVTSELQYVEIRRRPIDGGIVQQHRLEGKLADGTVLPGHEACLLIWADDGLITRIDEYFDRAAFDAVWIRVGKFMSAPQH